MENPSIINRGTSRDTPISTGSNIYTGDTSMSIYPHDLIAEALNMRNIYEVCPDFDLNDTSNVEENHFDYNQWFSWKGKNHTEESKELQRQAKLGPLNPNYGKPLPDDHPFKHGFQKGKKFSEEHKERMRHAKLDVKKSESHKYNMSEAQKKYFSEKVECPHCKKSCSKNHSATRRFHFDNCKMKKSDY